MLLSVGTELRYRYWYSTTYDLCGGWSCGSPAPAQPPFPKLPFLDLNDSCERRGTSSTITNCQHLFFLHSFDSRAVFAGPPFESCHNTGTPSSLSTELRQYFLCLLTPLAAATTREHHNVICFWYLLQSIE